ncbi:MAG: ferritin-like domain-containing protein [Firmicutes bacterium]|nr:ferritin-like domain-containing protein [Bacillota bacterium]
MMPYYPGYPGASVPGGPYPVPPYGPTQQLALNILEAIQGELKAAQVYRRLLQMATTQEDRENLQQILDDELKHLRMFTDLYARLTCMSPPPAQVTPPTFTTYMEGLKGAYYDELEAAEFYRSILLSTCDGQVQRVFFEAMTDEMEHAIRLNRLLYLAEEAEGED